MIFYDNRLLAVIVCWQTILKKYHTLFFSKLKKAVAIFGVCCSHEWCFKGKDLF